jgi:hypothetical protein
VEGIFETELRAGAELGWLVVDITRGLALISASLQTAWALFAEGQLLALSAVVVMQYAGWKNVRAGSEHLQNRQGGPL